MTSHVKKNVVGLATASLLIGLLAGCQGGGDVGVEVNDAWVKAADSGMTGMFADLTNPGGEEVSLVSARSDVAGFVEIHEVMNGMMREKDGGVVIPAGGTATLMPGGDHIMLMDLSAPVLAGETIPVTLSFSNGTEVTVEVLAKEFGGANEEYDPHGDRGEQ